MALHVATVGTSLLTNKDERPDQPRRPWMGWRFGNPLPTQEDALSFLKQADPRLASAETHTLSALPMLEGDRLALLHSDTPEGLWCAHALGAHYGLHGHQTAVRSLGGMGYDAGPFAERGLRALVSAAFDEIKRARKGGEAITLCATGGFKAETAIMTLVGLLTGTRVVYIHEHFRSIVEIPPVPIDWDVGIVSRNEAFFAWIDDEPRRIAAVRRRLMGAEPGLALLVDEGEDGCAYLSPAGELLHSAWKERSPEHAASRWPPPSDLAPEDKNALSGVAHHRPDGWERIVDGLTRLSCIERVRYDGHGDTSARESRVVARDAQSGTLRVVYASGDLALPLIIETTARNETETHLVESFVSRVLRKRS